jgi:uncharacterized protein (TIGR00297 family)
MRTEERAQGLPEALREVIRKLLHMSMGLFAIALHWLTPWQGALCALAALAHNLWLFPLYGYKRLLRPEERRTGYSGMLGYPAVVLALCLLFPHPLASLDSVRAAAGGAPPRVLWAAAGAWALLAFGDAFAALAGIFLKGPLLPWNPHKRWSGLLAFIVLGGSSATLMAYFVAYGDLSFTWAGIQNLLFTCLLAAAVGAVVETLPGQLDDNITVPLACGLVLVFFAGFSWAGFAWTVRAGLGAGAAGADFALLGLLLFNVLLGTAAWLRRWVTGGSALLGILWGSLVALGTGWQGYGFLLLFYLLANGTTYVGARRKRERGIAEGDGGRRGGGSVFSKGLFPALFALVSPTAMVSALAVYAADTAASEIGKLTRGATWLLAARRRARTGEAGGVSLLGSFAGIGTLLLFALLYALAFGLQAGNAAGTLSRFQVLLLRADLARFFLPAAQSGLLAHLPLMAISLFLAGLLCFFLESVLNETVGAKGWYPKEVIHLFLGGLAGALPFVIGALLSGQPPVPALWLGR